MNSVALNMASFTEGGPNKRTSPMSGSSLGRNACLMSGVRRERIVADERLALLAQIGSCRHRGIHQAICEHSAPVQLITSNEGQIR